jgi:uncharacterized protein
MNPLLEAHRQEILALARKRGAERIRVFGSMATDNAKPSSDVDFLVEMQEGKSAFALGGLLKDLEEILGRRVDITTPNALHPAIREKILREAVDL